MHERVSKTIFGKKFYLNSDEKEKLDLLLLTLTMLGCEVLNIYNEDLNIVEHITITFKDKEKRVNLQLYLNNDVILCNVGFHSMNFEDRWESNIYEAFDVLTEYF